MIWLCQIIDDTTPDGNKKYSIKEICEMISISKSTLYSYLGERNMPD